MDPQHVAGQRRTAGAHVPRIAPAEARGDAVAAIDPTDKEKLRRARKRATDRQSQRDHRERQRIYIRQLEETVQSYKDAFSGDGCNDVGALLKEQERLRTKCKSLEETLSRIGKMASSLQDSDHVYRSEQDARGSSTINPAQINAPTSQSPAAGADYHAPGQLHEPQSGNDQELPASSDAGRPVSDICKLPAHGMDYFGLCCDDAAALDTTMPLVHQVDTAEVLNLNAGDAAVQLTDGPATSLPIVPASDLSMGSPLGFEPAISADLGWVPPTHPSPPKMSQGTGRWDEILLSMVDEARLQHVRGQFNADEPSLQSLLSDKSRDVLAYRLFHHICSDRSIPLHLMLSIFWVQYLLLRWYVLGTEADFLRIPEFMRPTDLERRIQHRFCIGMLVWPDLRRALIRDSHTTDPERIGIEALEHMSRTSCTWSPTVQGCSDLIGSTDVLSIIERQSQRMEMWKVDCRFKEKYLQFADCWLG
ncbi:hypothetical protein ASPVEDRAFT_83296 [Aspergillus versicolor CBS 583.65]|uniref:BZIP domain-containing protein n=1 Tax=Aspergillus versicolor CBS 583.65 TaxID=1036611 RepID=A0A1L9PJR6_ASPVE|nr:uncharacterized protein ASPVEDRAFT_83296 [Aspergillus versicolor CBS 583.65]OJJ01768.1 hypothetical protein ASPVEDRAFT_83296 [Aspergillus versicolor CBS 583.65]